MKKIYLALMCMASLSLMTACGGDKKADKAAAAEGENTEMTSEKQSAGEQSTAEEQQDNDAEAWGDPTKAEVLNLKALYEAGDFKPAATVVFEDTLGGETAGELPSKWDIKRGGAEVGEANGHYYITLLGGDTDLAPIVNGGSKNYLSESYTMEFEFMFGRDVWFHVNYFDAEEEGVGDFNLWLGHSDWNFAKTDDEWIHGDQDIDGGLINRNGWNHFAASYAKGNMKLFLNGKRIANMPNIKQAASFIITGQDVDSNSHFIRNIRVAK